MSILFDNPKEKTPARLEKQTSVNFPASAVWVGSVIVMGLSIILWGVLV